MRDPRTLRRGFFRIVLFCLALISAQAQVERVPIRAVVIPESAFLEALSNEHFQVDRAISDEAIRIAASTNQIGAQGVIATISAEGGATQPFNGTIFIVVRDFPASPATRQITSHDFYVAAVELTGQSPWLGLGAQLLINTEVASAAALQFGSCCGPSTICVPNSSGGAPCGPNGYCTGQDIGVTNNPSQVMTQRQTNGDLVTNVQIFASGIGNITNPIFTGSCTSLVVASGCGVKKVSCSPGDSGFVSNSDGTADVDSGSACGINSSKPVRGRQIPYWCLYAHFDSPNASACQEVPFAPEVQIPWTSGVTNSPPLPGDFLPPMCSRARVVEGSNVCTTPDEQKAQKDLDMGALRATFGFQGGSRCEPTTATIGPNPPMGLGLPAGQTSSLYQCTACEPGVTGECRQWVEGRPLDTEPCPKDGTVCRTDYIEIIGHPPETEQPAPSTNPPTPEPKPNPPTPEPKPGSQSGPIIASSNLFGAIENTKQYTNTGTSQNPDPNKPKPSAANAPSSSPLTKQTSKQKLDPILLSDGSFDLVQQDLSFPGPVRPLQFVRTYNSRSDDQGTLGSNWVHNWDVWLEPMDQFNTPTWAMPYCLGADPGLFPRFSSKWGEGDPTVTCVMLHDGDGGAEMFYLDLGTRLYMPEAGRTATLTTTSDGGWAIRSSDGHIRLFTADGYMSEDRDRFGNGFHVDYEATPLWELYKTYCNTDALIARNETKHSRRCAFIAHMVGDGPPVELMSGWTIDANDYPLPGDLSTRAQIDYARAYFLYLHNLGPDVLPPYGKRKMRPTRVADDIGRSLVFTYPHAARCLPQNFCAETFDFKGTPAAEMLQRVSGPGETTVSFRYDRPASVPADFNEIFLTLIGRQDQATAAEDVSPASARSFTYHYQWPQGPVASYEAFSQKVFDKYLEYYRTFMGCVFALLSPCGERGLAQASPGDPYRIAKLAEYEYIARVVDNIVQVDDTPVPLQTLSGLPGPSIQSETRYVVDPWSLSFDRAYAQRYGSSDAKQNLSLIPRDYPGDNWTSKLPKATINHIRADQWATLPSQIRQNYPRENGIAPSSPAFVPSKIPSKATPEYPACTFSASDKARQELPGWEKPVEYFETSFKADAEDSRLLSTPMSCEQLALGTFGDPTHNDLMSSLLPITTSAQLSDHSVFRIVGRRQTTAANGNRICAWNQLIDRNGGVHYYGMNFRGQVLVDAVQESNPRGSGSDFIFSERVYNADGLVVQERRPVRGTHRWQPDDGYTRSFFDEIDPSKDKGWDAWLPVFWAHRMNLLRTEEHPAGREVLDFDEHANSFIKSRGRYQAFGYEPLFNQLKIIEKGSLASIAAGGKLKDVPHERTIFVFDYQELSTDPTAPADHSLGALLKGLIPWGFAWAETASRELDFAQITAWQLPLAFYDEDINGDGLIGFGYGSGNTKLARGVPVAAFRYGEDPLADPRVHVLEWAPNGQVTQLKGPDGDTVRFDYYSNSGGPTAVYGGNAPPADSMVYRGYAGFLGRIRMLRFDDTPYTFGPGSSCSMLAGPYQWLLPSSCSDPLNELKSLGLGKQAVAAILAASQAAMSESDPERYDVASFSYNALGGTRFEWSHNRATHIVRDTDGRMLQSTDPLGTTTAITYTVRGFPETTTVQDVSGVHLLEEARVFDETGAILNECAANQPGGCAGLPLSGSTRSYTYWPEGQLQTTTDPEGLVGTFAYNQRGLLTAERFTSPATPADGVIETQYQYDNDGNLVRKTFAPKTSVETSAYYAYDGLKRLVTNTDVRGYKWQVAFSNRDLLTHIKRDDTPYGPTHTKLPSWETAFAYDDFGDLLSRKDNGTTTLHLRRTTGGRVFQQFADGIGQTFVTFDRQGSPVWMRDPSGIESVFTRRSDGSQETASTIRRAAGKILTTGVVTDFDASERPTKRTDYGGGDERTIQWTRDGLGNVLDQIDAYGFITKYTYDLRGLVQTIDQQKTSGSNPTYETATYKYDGRGQVRFVIDPATQETEFQYDSFGRASRRISPGQQTVVRIFTYDALSRVDVETSGGNRIKHVYDKRGDATEDQLLIAGSRPITIAKRTFDDLGRLLTTSNMNPSLVALHPQDRTVTRTISYDSLSRVSLDSLKTGKQTEHPVTIEWSISPVSLWMRTLSFTLGASQAEWRETFDPALRMATKRSWRGQTTEFSWIGDIYSGRKQEQGGGHASPFRESVELDNFGAPIGWKFTGIDIDPAGKPANIADGIAYCGSTWNQTECARPLMESNGLRDVAGRLVSLFSNFGAPAFTGSTLVPRRPFQPWRGYEYDPSGRLATLWEDEGVNNTVSTAALRSHTVTPSDIRKLGNSSNEWDYVREANVGGTLSIHNLSSGMDRWTLPVPRGPGHQIAQVDIDGKTRTVLHNDTGQIFNDGPLEYTFDPRGQLASVKKNGTLVESYLYDGDGRLAGVVLPTATVPNQTFAYDGLQMVAAFGSQNQPLWEASWGPSLDQLLIWRDVSGAAENIPVVDHHNSVVGAWRPTTSRLSETAEYDPEGRVTVADAMGNFVCSEKGTGAICPIPGNLPFGYSSAWRSQRTGLVYMRNRWYSPELGQFISQDPIESGTDYNSYRYAAGDTINQSDPLGLDPVGFVSVDEKSKTMLPDLGQRRISTTPLLPLVMSVGVGRGPQLYADERTEVQRVRDQSAFQSQRNYLQNLAQKFPDVPSDARWLDEAIDRKYDGAPFSYAIDRILPTFAAKPLQTTFGPQRTMVRGAPVDPPKGPSQLWTPEIGGIPAGARGKLDFAFGRATGSQRNLDRTAEMDATLSKAGFRDSIDNRMALADFILQNKPALSYSPLVYDQTTNGVLILPGRTIKVEMKWNSQKLGTIILRPVNPWTVPK